MRIDDFNLNRRESEALRSYAKNGTFPQTFLIEGGTLETRLNFARFLANMIVCKGEGEKPCGICPACIKCRANSNPDIKQYGEEKENYTFKVETSRQIRQDAFVIPNDSDKKVYIITEAQNMNDSSENAMLKILEEPPHFDYFILTCSSKSAMLDTIISRASLISLSDAEETYSEKCVTLAENIAVSLCADTELELLKELSFLANDKGAFLETLSALTRIFTDALIFKQTGKNNSDFSDVTQVLCSKLSANKLYALTAETAKLVGLFKQNANYNLLITAMSGRLRSAVGK